MKDLDMIELDTSEDAAARAKIIKKAGGYPIGERGGLVWFTDLKTKTTLVLEPHEVTIERVKRKLRESRQKFGFQG